MVDISSRLVVCQSSGAALPVMAQSEVIDLEALPDDSAPKSHLREAEEKKEIGNEFYKIKDYKSALQQYTAAINLCPEKAAYYGNRSACYVMLGQYRQALEDSKRSIALDSSFTKGYVRAAKCFLAIGDLVGLKQALTQVETLGIKENMTFEINSLQKVQDLQNDAQNSYDKKDYRKVVYLMDRCLEFCPASDRLKLIKSECLALLGRCNEAQEIAFDICSRDSTNAEAIFVRGMCLYYQDKEQALKHFQHVLKLAPDHQKAMEFYKKAKALKQKKEEGNEAFKLNKLEEAYNLYNEALQVDPLNKLVNTKLYFNKATVCSKLEKLEEAVENCTKALEMDSTYVKALMRRAKCYSDLGKHDESVRDYEALLKIDKSPANRRLLQDAKLALKKSKRKDYYKILGIEKNASDDEIKKAYRKRALVLHPDRHVNATEEERREQERCFKELGEAYGVLSDPKKKSRYDYGQDIDEGELDANSVFQQFFSRGGGGGGGGGPGNSFFTFDCSGMSDGGVSFQFA